MKLNSNTEAKEQKKLTCSHNKNSFLNCSNLQFQMLEKNIILFDGVCNYCNSVVNFIIKRDKKNIFRFAPLQSETGVALAKKYLIPATIDSFIYIENDTVHTFSTGALKVCKHLGGFWPALSVLLIIPKFVRDGRRHSGIASRAHRIHAGH